MFKPYFGICKCHNLPNFIVVKSGLCKVGNEEKKDVHNPKRVLARESKTFKVFSKEEINESDSCSDLEIQLDAIFSLFIRHRGAVNGKNKCFTCGNTFFIEDIQCGHYIVRRHKSLRWEEKNAECQCSFCNESLGGNYEVYKQKIIDTYGIERLDWLNKKKHETNRMNVFEYKALISKFTKQLEELKHAQNIKK